MAFGAHIGELKQIQHMKKFTNDGYANTIN